MSARACPDWPALMEIAPDLQFRHVTLGEARLPVDAFVQLAGSAPTRSSLCCDLDAHVFNHEHTDDRVVEALRGTHWIDVREISGAGLASSPARLGSVRGAWRASSSRSAGHDPKQRLAWRCPERAGALAEAMLADVVGAAEAVGPVLVVAPPGTPCPPGATLVDDPRRGQGAAVRAGLAAAARRGAAGAVPRRERRPAVRRRARPARARRSRARTTALALVAAADGTTNALAFADASLFEPVYGPGSAERFAALGPSTAAGRAESHR